MPSMGFKKAVENCKPLLEVKTRRVGVANPHHMAYTGGPGGIQHTASPAERAAENEQHTSPTSVQTQHATAARADKTSFAKANGGHPKTLAVQKPLAEEKRAAPAAVKTEAKPKAEPKTEAKPKAEPKTEAKPKAEPTWSPPAT